MNKPLRIGFDFDGVILYNPFRITRPLVYLFKKIFLKKRVEKFFIPKPGLSRQIMKIMHASSYKPNDGFQEFLALSKNENYQLYIITGRFSFLETDLKALLTKYNLTHIPLYQNKDDEQPTLFKARIINKLNLDYFVEDNWDVVKLLNKETKTKVLWIRNLIDRWFIKYQPQVDNLEEAIKKILNFKF